MDFQQILNEIREEVKPYRYEGEVASYIPELAKVTPDKFGMYICNINGESSAVGDFEEKFSIQSIAKVLSLAYALKIAGENIWQRVNVEPSGNPFNSLVQLEYEEGIPRNPFINSGALVIADILVSNLENPKEDFLEFVRKTSGVDDINFNPLVADSERDHGFLNAALVNYMKAFQNIRNDVDEVLDFYFHICSLEMSCAELSRSFLFLANKGKICGSKEQILSTIVVKRINSLMQTCGFYDEAGEFAFRVGLPGKSGVGGGIAAVHPEDYSVAVWGPRLNEKGNSVLGMKALELLTTKTGMSIF